MPEVFFYKQMESLLNQTDVGANIWEEVGMCQNWGRFIESCKPRSQHNWIHWSKFHRSDFTEETELTSLQVYLSQREEDAGLVERVKRKEREKMKVIFLISVVRLSFQSRVRSRRNAGLKGKQGVMYINLDGGGGEKPNSVSAIWIFFSGGEQCPSTADSSAVSLSQMAFLSMAVSIFRSTIKWLERWKSS